jgi:O-antigen/teichoic acid export membrane protein
MGKAGKVGDGKVGDIQRVGRNLVAKFLGEFSVRLLGALSFFVLARYMGAGTFGSYLSALAFAGMFVVIHEAGFHLLLTREIARAPGIAVALSLRVGRIKAAASLLVCVIAPVAAWITGMDRHMVLLVGLASLAVNMASFVEMIGAIFQGLERMDAEAVVRTVHKVFLIAVPLGAWFVFSRTGYVLAGQAAASFAVLAIGAFLLSRMKAMAKVRRVYRDPAGIWKWLGEVWPLTAATLFSVLAARVDLVLLSRFRPMEDAGIFGAASRLLEFSQVLPALLVGVMFPVLSRMAVEKDSARRDRTYDRLFRWFIAMSFPVAVLQYTWSAGIVGICYGAGYVSSAGVLKVLSVSMFFSFIGYLFSNGLIASDRQKSFLFLTATVCAVNIGMNIWAIPRYGPEGAAWVRVASDGVFFALGLVFFSRLVRPVSFGAILRLGVPALLLLGLGRYFQWNHLAGTVSAAAYPVLLVFSGGLVSGDLVFLRKLVRGRD